MKFVSIFAWIHTRAAALLFPLIVAFRSYPYCSEREAALSFDSLGRCHEESSSIRPTHDKPAQGIGGAAAHFQCCCLHDWTAGGPRCLIAFLRGLCRLIASRIPGWDNRIPRNCFTEAFRLNADSESDIINARSMFCNNT